jgi:hypothetical protein
MAYKIKVKQKKQKILTRLSMWEYWVDKSEFDKIWKDKRMSEHLWGKFKERKHSILALWGELDEKNQQILSSYLKKKKVI